MGLTSNIFRSAYFVSRGADSRYCLNGKSHIAYCQKGFRPGSERDPADVLSHTLGEISRYSGRTGKSKNLIIGSNHSEDLWRQIDKEVNKYPGQRTFTAIGIGGPEFKQTMVEAVETHVGPVHLECISQRESANGKYLSVKVGPVWVESVDQVVAVYSLMKADTRVKWCM